MKLRYCGVRGSTPAPGGEFVRTGGHTSCIALTSDGDALPRLVLDAGSGIRRVSEMLGGAAFDGTILLTHLHWDHWQGLPFFAAADRDDARVRLLVPTDGDDPERLLRRAMSPPHFPIGPEGLRGSWTFDAIDEGTIDVEGFRVTACRVPHKGGRTFGYRIEDAASSIAYVPDHRPAPSGSGHAAIVALCRGVDLLIHDAQFIAGEEAVAEDYGHATVDQAVELAFEAGASELALFHHAPGRTDDQLDAIERSSAGSGLVISIAREGVDRVPAPPNGGEPALTPTCSRP